MKQIGYICVADPWDRKETEEEDDDDDEERFELDVTKIVKKEKREVDLTELIENAYAKCDTFESRYLELRRCVAVPIEDAVMFEGDEYPAGTYYVVRELSPGEYKIYADEDEESGFFAILKMMADGKRSIVTNGSFSNQAYVEVKDGQLLELRRCTLK